MNHALYPTFSRATMIKRLLVGVVVGLVAALLIATIAPTDDQW